MTSVFKRVLTCRYCGDECGRRLARHRLYQILPSRIQEWNSTPTIASEHGKRELERIRVRMEQARNELSALGKCSFSSRVVWYHLAPSGQRMFLKLSVSNPPANSWLTEVCWKFFDSWFGFSLGFFKNFNFCRLRFCWPPLIRPS